jgi:hypothetical protein
MEMMEGNSSSLMGESGQVYVLSMEVVDDQLSCRVPSMK